MLVVLSARQLYLAVAWLSSIIVKDAATDVLELLLQLHQMVSKLLWGSCLLTDCILASSAVHVHITVGGGMKRRS